MNRDHTTTMRDIMMRLQSCDRSAYMQPLFDQSERVSSVVHTRNRSAIAWYDGTRCSTSHYMCTALAVPCTHLRQVQPIRALATV